MIFVFILVISFTVGCNIITGNQGKQYNAIMFDKVREYMYEDFLMKNITRKMIFYNDEMDIEVDSNQEIYPESITYLVTTQDEFDNIFSYFPSKVDFNNSIVCLYMFTFDYANFCVINNISCTGDILNIHLIREKGKMFTGGDFYPHHQRCLAVLLDKIDVKEVKFEIEY